TDQIRGQGAMGPRGPRVAPLLSVVLVLLAASLSSAPAGAATCTPGPKANLKGCNFAGRDLSGANLTGANLAGANLTSANLTNANVSGANLYAARFSKATLTNANLYGTKLKMVSSGGIVGRPA